MIKNSLYPLQHTNIFSTKRKQRNLRNGRDPIPPAQVRIHVPLLPIGNCSFSLLLLVEATSATNHGYKK